MSLDRVIIGDCRETLACVPGGSVQCCVTSPPYWGLRDYGVANQIGLEATPEEYVEQMVAVFREIRRALRDDGTLWLNLGDCYAGEAGGGQGKNGQRATRTFTALVREKRGHELKPKDLVGIPWRVAFALRAAGWYLRSEIIWAKPNPMPESVRDRPTKSHEQVFLLTKSDRYFYDADAIAEPAVHAGMVLDYTGDQKANDADPTRQRTRPRGRTIVVGDTRNARDVWRIASQPFSGAHFATMPIALATRCILAGSRPGDTVLDPFLGSGTVAEAAQRLGRRWLGCELNPKYGALIEERTRQTGLVPAAQAPR